MPTSYAWRGHTVVHELNSTRSNSGKKYPNVFKGRELLNVAFQKLPIAEAIQKAYPQIPSPKVLQKIHELLKQHEMVAEVTKIFQEREGRERDFVERYGHARPPMAIKAFGDKMMIAVGGFIYEQTREGAYTFMHAIHDHALELFGVPMLEAEEEKPLDERHPALQWMAAFVEHQNTVINGESADPHASQIGAGAAWCRFAYDLYTIKDNATLEAILAKRLVNPGTFQSARHELWIAALCVSAGFNLAFEDESDNTKTHPEFIATDKFSDVRIAVEAKSRRRKTAYGFTGGKDIAPGEMVDSRQLILDAYKKKTELPFYVFVDVNLPAGDEKTYERWLAEIDRTWADLAQEGYAAPSPANVVFFSNDPSHYLRDQQIGNREDSLWIKPYKATHPAVPHPEPDILERLMKAWKQRAVPPKDFPMFDKPIEKSNKHQPR